jgi:hypothetical protein
MARVVSQENQLTGICDFDSEALILVGSGSYGYLIQISATNSRMLWFQCQKIICVKEIDA